MSLHDSLNKILLTFLKSFRNKGGERKKKRRGRESRKERRRRRRGTRKGRRGKRREKGREREGGMERKELILPAEPKIFTLWPLQRKFLP